MKKEDYFGKYFLREGDFKPEKIHDRTWREFGLTVALCEKWLEEGVLFFSKEDAEMAQRALIQVAFAVSRHMTVPEPEQDILVDPNTPRIYISGPIDGYNLIERRETFKRVQTYLELQGYDVFNPMENGLPAEATTQQHMLRDLAELTREKNPYDAIYMMKGWQHSKNCTTEFNVATALGLNVFFEQAGEMIRFI